MQKEITEIKKRNLGKIKAILGGIEETISNNIAHFIEHRANEYQEYAEYLISMC